MKKPWYQTAKRWIQLNVSEDICLHNNLEYWRKEWREHPYQGLILNCCSQVRFCQCGLEYIKPAKDLGDQDIFGIYCQAAKEDGLAVAARFDLQYTTKEFLKLHPEWFQRNEKGNFIEKEGFDLAATCINGPYYSEIIPKIIQEIIEKYHVDAITDNSWKANRKTTICYCDNCKRKFMEDTGLSLPKRVDWEDPVYRRWVKWSYALRIKLWDFLAETARKAGGEDCIWAGMLHCDPMNRLNEFVDFHEIGKRLRFLFLDHQCRDRGNGMDMEQNSMNGSLFHLLSEQEIIISECTSHYVRYPDGIWFRLASAPAAETQMWEQEAIMGGIVPWIHYSGIHTYDNRRMHISNDILDWHQKYEEYLCNRTEIADVGVLWSQENGDFYGKGNAEHAIMPWNGFRHALTKGRIPYLPIHTQDIKKYGDRVKVLVLPDLTVLNQSEQNDLVEYLKRGGNLVMTGKSGMIVDTALPHPLGTEKSPLWEYLGLCYLHEVGYDPDSGMKNNGRLQTYIHITDQFHPVFSGFEQTESLCFGGLLEVVKSSGSLKAISDYIPGIPVTPIEYSYPQKICTDIGSIFAGTLSSGSKVVYIAGDVDRLYARYELPDHALLLQNSILWAIGQKPFIQVRGSGYINIKAYKQGDRIILHFNNLTGSSIKSGYADEFISLNTVEVDLNLDLKKISKVEKTVEKGVIPFEYTKNGIHFSIPHLLNHEMIIIS